MENVTCYDGITNCLYLRVDRDVFTLEVRIIDGVRSKSKTLRMTFIALNR